jgi:hypothetical protein
MSNLKLSLGINNMLITLKRQTIEAIFSILKERKHANIELHKPIHHASITVDDVITQSNFSVLRDSGETVIIQTGYNCEPVELKDMPIEQLMDLLMTIENNGYEWAADGDAIELK